MTNNESTLGRHILGALLAHPDTVVIMDEDGRMRLAYADELETAKG